MNQTQQDYNWIQNIIRSCNNTFHFDGVNRLIELFAAKHDDQELHQNLMVQCHQQYNSIHVILT